MAGLKSKRKGACGEREASKRLSATLGVPLARGVQFRGGQDSPDVVGLDGIHIEVKRDESTIGKSLYKALAQADGDCGSNIPMVISRRNQEDWVIAVRLDNLVEFCRRVVRIAGMDNNAIPVVWNNAHSSSPVFVDYRAAETRFTNSGSATTD